jgi:hypothetical protein
VTFRPGCPVCLHRSTAKTRSFAVVLRDHLTASYAATANGYGLTPVGLRPQEVLGVLETRYDYWTLDAEHEDPFPPISWTGPRAEDHTPDLDSHSRSSNA